MLDWKSAAVAVLNPLLLPLHYRSSGGVWCGKVGQYRYGRPTRDDNKLLWKKDAICMALMSLQGPFEKPSNHNLNNTVQFCLQPFSLLLKWRWKPTGKEIKSLKKTAKQPRWDEKQDWLTLTVTAYAHWGFCTFLRSPFAIHQRDWSDPLHSERGSISDVWLLQRCLTVETPDSDRFYEITLFSECAVIPFLQ